MTELYLGATIGLVNLLIVLAIMHLSNDAPMDDCQDDTWQSLIDRIRQESENDPLK